MIRDRPAKETANPRRYNFHSKVYDQTRCGDAKGSENMATKKLRVDFNPCCFCSRPIEKNNTDPCRITVETANGKWQVWFCHGNCFRQKLSDLPEAPGLFEPANF